MSDILNLVILLHASLSLVRQMSLVRNCIQDALTSYVGPSNLMFHMIFRIFLLDRCIFFKFN